MDIKQPSIWPSLNSTCCSAPGITCDVNIRVVAIDWNNLSLDGKINETAIPSAISVLSLYRNSITGSIPVQLPNTLTELTLYRNELRGLLPSLPNGLLILNVDSNLLSGNIPLLPSSLQQIILSNNQFTGILNVGTPSELDIHQNWFINVLVTNASLLAICDLSKNPMLGNSDIDKLVMCTANNLYDNVCVGYGYEGQAVRCGAGVDTSLSFLNGIYRYTCGILKYYPNPSIARSWDTSWSNPTYMNCENTPFGSFMIKNKAIMPQGQTFNCANETEIYRFSCGLMRKYPDTIIASSWDYRWASNAILMNCTGITRGPDMSMRIGNENDICPSACPTTTKTVSFLSSILISTPGSCTRDPYIKLVYSSIWTTKSQLATNHNTIAVLPANLFKIQFTMLMVFRVIIDIFLLVYVLKITAITRELKKKIRKAKK